MSQAPDFVSRELTGKEITNHVDMFTQAFANRCNERQTALRSKCPSLLDT